MIKNKKKNGFTLIELLAVVIVLGVILLLAVPNISKYIERSRNEIYITNAKAMFTSVRNEVNALTIKLPVDIDHATVIPLEKISLEQGGKRSPYGDYDMDRSYMTITLEDNEYEYYLTLVDLSGRYLNSVKEEDLDSITPQSDANVLSTIKKITDLRNKDPNNQFKVSGFRLEYVEEDENGIIQAIKVYPVYTRGSLVELIDGSKWYVITYRDEGKNKNVLLVTYDNIIGHTGATAAEINSGTYAANYNNYRNRLISGGLPNSAIVTLKYLQLEDLCGSDVITGICDDFPSRANLFHETMVINHYSGQYSIDKEGYLNTIGKGAIGGVHLSMNIDKTFIKTD